MHGAGGEISSLTSALVRVSCGQFVRWLPALAGLAAGWWAAAMFTDSQLFATLHSWAIGHGASWAASTESFEAMRVWFPIAAAAVCAYVGNRFGARIRARYAAPALEPRQ